MHKKCLITHSKAPLPIPTISPRNLDETFKIMRGSETTFQDLQFECNRSALAQVV